MNLQPPYGLLVRFTAYTGLRAGELVGLRIRDVNLVGREVSVVQTIQRVKGVWVIGTPKSSRSTRQVPLIADHVVAALHEYIDQHPKPNGADSLLRPGHDRARQVDYDRHLDRADFYRTQFPPACERAGLGPVRLHDLRHSFATMMFAARFEPYKVSRWLGHTPTSPSQTASTATSTPPTTPARQRNWARGWNPSGDRPRSRRACPSITGGSPPDA